MVEQPVRTVLRRRLLLQLALAGSAASLLAACAPAAPAAPTSQPAAGAPPKAAAPVAPQVITSGAGVPPMSPRGKLKLTFGTAAFNLPLFLALEKGYFDHAGLDISVDNQGGRPRDVLIPMMTRGELDVAEIGTAPALYNALAEGFDPRVVASLGTEMSGRTSPISLLVDKDKASQFKDLSDLRGKTIEASRQYGGSDRVVQEALRAAGLTAKDVNVTYRVKTLPDFQVLPKQHAADVYAVPEPMATVVDQEGFAVRWKRLGEFMPWFQTSVLGSSGHFIEANRPALVTFLAVYVAASREINAANGAWTDDLVRIEAKWAEQPPEVIRGQGAVPAFESNGLVSAESLARDQAYWAGEGQVKVPSDMAKLVDLSPLDEALRIVGRV